MPGKIVLMISVSVSTLVRRMMLIGVPSFHFWISELKMPASSSRASYSASGAT